MSRKKDMSAALLPGVAGVLVVWHCLYSLLHGHLTVPDWFRYGNYAMVLLVGAVCLWVGLCALRRKAWAGKQLGEITDACNHWPFFLLVMLYLCFCISAAWLELETPGALSANRGALYDAAMNLFFLFPFGCWLGMGKGERFVRLLTDVLTASFLLILLYGLWGLYTRGFVPLGDVGVFVHKGRFYLGCNPNTTGMVSAALMMLGLWRFLRGGRLVKWLYGFAEVILYVGLALSESRGSLLAAAVSFGVFAGLLAWQTWRHPGKCMRWMLALGTGVAVALVFWFARGLVQMTIPTENLLDGRAVEARGLISDGDDSGSGRLQVWGNTLRGVLSGDAVQLLRGCGSAGITPKLRQFGVGVSYTHNQFLEVLTAWGLPAMLIYLLWLVLLAGKCWRIGVAAFERVSLAERVLPLLILLLVINNLFEARLLFYRYVTGNIFFLVAGYVFAMGNRKESKEESL